MSGRRQGRWRRRGGGGAGGYRDARQRSRAMAIGSANLERMPRQVLVGTTDRIPRVYQLAAPPAAVRSDVIRTKKHMEPTVAPAFSVSPASVLAANMITNPDGEEVGGPQMVSAMIPDADGHSSIKFVETGRMVHTCNATGGIIVLDGYTSVANQPAVSVITGVDPFLTGTYCQTTVTTTGVSTQNAQMVAMIPSNNATLRMTSAILRVKLTSPAETAGGLLYGYQSQYHRSFGSNAGDQTSNAQLMGRALDAGYPVQKGICVRKRLSHQDMEMNAPVAYVYSRGALPSLYGERPVVVYAGSNTNTVVVITWSIHYEVVCPAAAAPFPVSEVTADKNWPLMLEYCNEKCPLSSEGNSFKNFLNQVWGGIKKVAKVSWDNRDLITALASKFA